MSSEFRFNQEPTFLIEVRRVNIQIRSFVELKRLLGEPLLQMQDQRVIHYLVQWLHLKEKIRSIRFWWGLIWSIWFLTYYWNKAQKWVRQLFYISVGSVRIWPCWSSKESIWLVLKSSFFHILLKLGIPIPQESLEMLAFWAQNNSNCDAFICYSFMSCCSKLWRSTT